MQSKLILGTAQFGSDYGIKHDGQPSTKEIEEIARLAWDSGICSIYTYNEYGDQSIIHEIFKEFEFIIKKGIYPDWFEWDGRRGLSVYEIHEVATTVFKEWDAFQFPVNVLDHRFLKMIKMLKKEKYEIHARSIFLQGLLLMDSLPIWLTSTTRTVIDWFHSICKKEKLEYYEAALGWVLGLEDIDHVIVGVNNAEQLEQLLEVKPLRWDYDFSIRDENILNPRKWPTLHNQLKKSVESSTAIEGVNIKL